MKKGIKKRKTGWNERNKNKIPTAEERKMSWHVKQIAQKDAKTRKHAENSVCEGEAHTSRVLVQSCLLVLSTQEWQCVPSLSVLAAPPSGVFCAHPLTGGLQLTALLYISGARTAPWPLWKILARIFKGSQWVWLLQTSFFIIFTLRQDPGKRVELKQQNVSSGIISNYEKSWCVPVKVTQNNPIHSVIDMLSSHRNLKIGKFTKLRKFNGSMNHVDLYCCRLVTVRYHF